MRKKFFPLILSIFLLLSSNYSYSVELTDPEEDLSYSSAPEGNSAIMGWTCIMTKWLIQGNGLIAIDMLNKYMSDLSTACNQSETLGVQGSEDADILDDSFIDQLLADDNFENYPGCDTPDIVLGNGQVWAACNVGAPRAYDGVSQSGIFMPAVTQNQIGHYFQWGQMIGWVSQAGEYPVLGYEYPQYTITSEIFNPTYSPIESWSETINYQGPCRVGYHIPTYDEWNQAYEYVGISKQNEFNNILKLTAEFNLGSENATLYNEGAYWSQDTDYGSWSPQVGTGGWAKGYTVSRSAIMYMNSYSTFTGVKSLPARIRCIKN